MKSIVEHIVRAVVIFLQSVSSEDSVPVFELSGSSTISSENGVYPLRSSEGDVPENDSLEESENEVIIATDESVFAEPQVHTYYSSFLYVVFHFVPSRLLLPVDGGKKIVNG